MDHTSKIIANALTIRDYTADDQCYFESFNRAWIERYFEMEPVDFTVLQNPEEYILKKGGSIFMAVYNGQVVGTVALKFLRPLQFEFTKMAVDENFQGKGIGRALANHAIERAAQAGAESIVLYSSTKLKAALALYQKLGFKQIELDGPYKRSDIKMKLNLKEST